MTTSRSNAERETIIRIDYEGRRVHLWTTEAGWMRLAARLGMIPEPGTPGGFSGPYKSGRPGRSLKSLLGVAGKGKES